MEQDELKDPQQSHTENHEFSKLGGWNLLLSRVKREEVRSEEDRVDDIQGPNPDSMSTGNFDQGDILSQICKMKEEDLQRTVTDLLDEIGFSSQAREESVQRIVDILKTGRLPTKSDLSAAVQVPAKLEVSDSNSCEIPKGAVSCTTSSPRRASKRRNGRIMGKKENGKSGVPAFTPDSCLDKEAKVSPSDNAPNDDAPSDNAPNDDAPSDTAASLNSDKKKMSKCYICVEQFSTPSHLIQHLEEKHPDRPGSDCALCGKHLATKGNLKFHMFTHTGEQHYKCSICSKAFNHPRSLQQHRRIHTGEKPYKCSKCPQAFINSSHLKRHESVHSEEKPLQCSVCSKSFKHQSNLKSHLKMHSDEKPYVCVICGCQFKHSSKVRRHMRVHTGEKPHKCAVCGKAFASGYDLKNHEKTHTGEKPYQCSKCDKSFSVNTNLNKHYKTHHLE